MVGSNGAITPKVTLEAITPAIASQMLGTMKGNRTLRKGECEKYARDMVAGKWEINGETIKFDWTGALIDGQHRLRAIVMAKKSVQLLVARGVDPASIITLDSGIRRSFSDFSVIGGRPYPGLSGTIARWWYKYDHGSPTVGYRPSHQELEQVIQEHAGISDSAAFILRHKVIVRRCTASVQGFVHAYAAEKYDRELADLFISDLESGAGLPEGSPILALRRRLVDSGDATGKDVQSSHVLAWTIKAWNAWLAGEKLKRVTWQPQGVGSGTEAFPRFEQRKPRDLVRMAEQAAAARTRRRQQAAEAAAVQ